MRATWSGSITFGLITIPVRLYGAVSNKSVDLHLVHEEDGERVHYKRVCDKGHEVDWDDIARAKEIGGGEVVIVSDEELEALDTDSVRAIDVDAFVPLDDIDPIYFDKTYYVGPEESGVKAYRLLCEALESEEVVGVSKVALRQREHLAAIRLRDGMLVLETMHWPDEIRAADIETLDLEAKISDRERDMARQLVRQLTSDFEPERYEDDYRLALEELIRKKAEGETIKVPEREETTAEVTDLMEALKASVDAARSGKKRSAPKRGSRKQDLSALSKAELYERAQELEVEGRSSMDKDELIDAIGRSA